MTAVTRPRWAGAAGALLALATFAGGIAIERLRFGADVEATFARVEREVRARIDELVAAQRTLTGDLVRPELLASSGPEATRTLMALADTAVASDPDVVAAASVFDLGGRPLAWSGRPSNLSSDTIRGPEAILIAPGALGPRLIHLLPVVDTSTGRRSGTVATEFVVPGTPGASPTSDTVQFQSVVPVELQPWSATPPAGAADGTGFLIEGPTGEPLLRVVLSREAALAAREEWRRQTTDLSLTILGLTFLALAAILLRRRRELATGAWRRTSTSIAVILLGLARLMTWVAYGPRAGPAAGADGWPPGLSPRILFRSPLDLLLTALVCLGIVVLAGQALDRWRIDRQRRRRLSTWLGRGLVPFTAVQLAQGVLVSLFLVIEHRMLAGALPTVPVDILRFSFAPWDPQRLLVLGGLTIWHASVLWACVLVFGTTPLLWRSPPARLRVLVAQAATWGGGMALAWAAGWLPVDGTLPWSTVWSAAAVLLLTFASARWQRPYRHASQGFRMVVGSLALVVPALLLYPTLLEISTTGTRRLIETQYGPDALSQRELVQRQIRRSQDQIDGGLTPDEALARGPNALDSRDPGWNRANRAYELWARTDLARALATSSVEIFGADGSLVSRFAFDLPEEDAGVEAERWTQQGCEWETYEEVSPLGGEERRLVFAGRGLCDPSGRSVGAIVIRAMLDYDALPFLTSRRIPSDLLRLGLPRPPAVSPTRELEIVIYGWSRRAIYTSTESAWLLRPDVFSSMTRSRDPVWVTTEGPGTVYDVYLLNDRAGIYGVGYAHLSLLDHVINLAEVAVFALVGYLVLLAAYVILLAGTGLPAASRTVLVTEIRESFYRKLLLAFVLVSLLPVATLYLVTRAFITAQARTALEAEAVRTVAVARRVVEDYASLVDRTAAGLPDLDPLMVGISRAIDQDVNVFDGPQLEATSERFLFESRLLPNRTPSRVYRALVLDRQSSFVGDETVGDFSYLVAGTPVRVADRNLLLTIPLTLQEQQTRREVDALDRRILLAAVIFVLLGSALGYRMAERISDPVNRVTRATRRIAGGDLTAHIAEPSSDELRTMITAFNQMASDLRRQRLELERTHRDAAWAEMARQVAHEIKNPLTPIQLSAEHLRHVHADRGAPLHPVLEECVEVILAQVRLLRQIASEFSAFASSPTPRTAPTSLAELVHDIVQPYRTGLPAQISIVEAVPADLPPLSLDRALFSRTLTNLLENALHAMPSGGTLTVAAGQTDDRIRLTVSDSGEGMEADALAHAFEPYFSTKTGGTGLGLPIARRTVELHGGTITVESRRGEGTRVTIELPVATGHRQPD